MIKVAKFGGSSVSNSHQFEKVKKIIEQDFDRRYIVVSACGKAFSNDHKVTDLLYLTHAHMKYGVSYEPIFQMIEQKYNQIKQDLQLTLDLQHEFEMIRQQIKENCSLDYLVSRGEYLTAKLMAEYVGYQFVDAKDCIFFQYDGNIDYEKTKYAIEHLDVHQKGFIIPGFYGSLPSGMIKVMSRGGSDITGAIIANVIDADLYENWTDVSGFYICNPAIVDRPLQIRRITYNELRQMSYMGANVFHDDAVFPVKVKNIPIEVKNTNASDMPGTIIVSDCTEYDLQYPPYAITGITGKKDYTLITVVKSHSSSECGYLRKLLSIFEDYRVSVEFVPGTVDTCTFIVQSEAVNHHLYEIIGKIKQEEVDDVIVEDEVALVSIVGRAMKQKAGMSGQLLSEFGASKINIKTISQTSDELSIVVGVKNADYQKAIRCIYNRFIKESKEVIK